MENLPRRRFIFDLLTNFFAGKQAKDKAAGESFCAAIEKTMHFELIVDANFKDLPSKNYINDCCIGGDEILDRLKNAIAAELTIDAAALEIYQEDWGWALEYSASDVFYLLAISNTNEPQTNQTTFSGWTQATRRVKQRLFNKTIDAETESDEFAETILKSIKKQGWTIKKDEV